MHVLIVHDLARSRVNEGMGRTLGIFVNRDHFFIISTLVCVLWLVSASAHASYECPKPSQQLAPDVSIKIESAVSSLPQETTPKFDAKAETVTRDLFAKYPDAGKLVLAHSMISMFCQAIFTSSFTDAQKLDHLYRLEEWITRISGVSVPMSRTSGTTCSNDPDQVLRPIRAVFDAWANLNIREYLDQWGPDSIQRSKYYARKISDIQTQRISDFRKYSSVTVQSIEPKILFSDGTKARVDNTYSMRFVRLDGRVINESGVEESYVLECSTIDHSWRIRENNDYLIRS